MVCPFLDEDEPRCGEHLSLSKLDHALGLCADRYEECPLYQEMLLAHAAGQASPESVFAAG